MLECSCCLVTVRKTQILWLGDYVKIEKTTEA